MKTINKAVALLDRFSERATVLGVTDLSQATGLDKSVVHGLLRSLVHNGLIEQVPDGRKYRLGPKMLSYGHVRAASMPVIDCARDVVRDLCDKSGESTQLSLFVGDAMQVALAFECDLPARVGFRVGRMLSLHCTATGLAVLSAMPEPFVDTLVSEPLKKMEGRPDMLMDPKQVRALVEEARARGVAYAERTFTSDVTSVGAPVLDAAGDPIAAVAVAAPAHRMDRERMEQFGALVRAAAARISEAMGYVGADRAA